MTERVMQCAARALCLFLLFPLATVVATAADSGDDEFRLLKLGGHMVKWGSTELGTGAVVSYAFALAPQHFSDAGNCRDLVPMDDLERRSGIARTELRKEAAAAFRVWEDAADISFIPVDDPDQADILIGAQGQPTGRAFASVDYQAGDYDDVKPIHQARVCLNPEQPWKVGFDGDTDVYDIRYTLVHEIGHAIGLDHPGPSGQVMSFRYTEQYQDLQPGDLRGVEQLYGASIRRLAAEDDSN